MDSRLARSACTPDRRKTAIFRSRIGPDRLGGGKDSAIVEIEISSLKSFRPESLAERMPAARDLLRLRSLLSGVRGATARVEDKESECDWQAEE